ncbi:hypothetical protein Trydic_g6675 [Trypoxylus dichotomus]
MDRNRSKKNIVFFNASEETFGGKNCRVATDVVTCKNMLSRLDVVFTDPIKSIRLGKYDSSNKETPTDVTALEFEELAEPHEAQFVEETAEDEEDNYEDIACVPEEGVAL